MPRKNVRIRMEVLKAVEEEGIVKPKLIAAWLRERGIEVSESYVRALLTRMRREGLLKAGGERDRALLAVERAIEALDRIASEAYVKGVRDIADEIYKVADGLRYVRSLIMTGWRERGAGRPKA